MTTTNIIAGRDLETLRTAITGQVFVPGEAGYDQARQAWNLAVDQRPAVVVEAGSAADVAQAVRYARAHGIRIAPQGTGHGAGRSNRWTAPCCCGRHACASAHRPGRPHRPRRGRRYMAGRDRPGRPSTAWPRWPGTSPNVGVTGYTLGGGLGPLARRYGLAANSVTAAELVTPDGDLVRADADHEPDLFWACAAAAASAW